jgi:hypothetical protein
METGDYHVTFEFPEFRWTHIVDRHMLESMTGYRKGPVMMSNHPIQMVSVDSIPAWGDPDAKCSTMATTI